MRHPRAHALLLLASVAVLFAQTPVRGLAQQATGAVKQQETKLIPQFDTDGDGRLNAAERKKARAFLAARPTRRPAANQPDGEASNRAVPGSDRPDVKADPEAPLYDPGTVRTLFLDFEEADWEQQLVAFNNTDVDVPATLVVDGRTYRDVGVHFRGETSFNTVGDGFKRSLNLSLDFVHDQQNIGGYRTLNLLNSHLDPTYLRTVLYFDIARQYIPAPKANYVRVVINGESWGVYVNVQQFNKDFVKEWFGTAEGTRWHVPGHPNAGGSLMYLGEDPESYKMIYLIKSKDDAESWAALIHLCKVLNDTPPNQLEAALEPLLEIENTLKFLALENALVNNDGYWIRTSDYDIYRDLHGRFHIIPYDANETFVTPGGLGAELRGVPPFRGIELDPLYGVDDPSLPLISKLLAVPSLRARYLAYVREIAQMWLDWKKLGPLVQQYHSLIADDVAGDTRKLYSTEAFHANVTHDVTWPGFGEGAIGLKNFADQRRAYLLKSTAR